ncbi:MAG: hypothetical protein AAGA75_28815 [Cyanobacteria bacterium P01_E01_bin.6]
MQSELPNNDPVYSELTFYYMDGRNETFTVNSSMATNDSTSQGFQVQVRHMLKKEWWILHLPEQSVFINVDNVIKVEMKPPIAQLHGEDVFMDADRVTALSRAR